MDRSRLAVLVLVCLCVMGSVVRADPAVPPAPVEARAHELERRLIAPCCFRETLDVHESPIATELRREIRRRLGAGESVEAIEASLIARHGARMRATLPGSLGYVLAAVLFLGGPAILLLVWRRLRGGALAEPAAPWPAPAEPAADLSPQERRRLEELLDDELESPPPPPGRS